MFSIITPVYNAQKYLDECIKSVLAQSYKNFEFILADDGSNDSSLEIIKKYAILDSRIKYFSKINEGQGIIRNQALKQAKGDYVLYLDCDDWLEDDALLKLKEKFKKDDSDIVFFNVYKFFEENKAKIELRYIDIYSKFKQEPFCVLDIKDILFSTNALPYKAYKRNFLVENNIKYSNTRFIEDSEFYFRSMLSASKISCLDEYILNYRIHKNSTTFKQNKRIATIKKTFFICEKILEESKYKDIKEIKASFLKNRIGQLFHYWRIVDKRYKKKYFYMMKKIFKYIKEKYSFEPLKDYFLLNKCKDCCLYPYEIYKFKRLARLFFVSLKSYIEI